MRYAIAILLASTVSAGAESALYEEVGQWTVFGDDHEDTCTAVAGYGETGKGPIMGEHGHMNKELRQTHDHPFYNLGITVQAPWTVSLSIRGPKANDSSKPIQTPVELGPKSYDLRGAVAGEMDGSDVIVFPNVTKDFFEGLGSESRLYFKEIDTWFSLQGSRRAFMSMSICLNEMRSSEPVKPVEGNTL